jgi:hypothetical protein
MSDDRLDGYTIYRNPSDAPGMYVLRAWVVNAHGQQVWGPAVATEMTDKALDVIRRTLLAEGRVRFDRDETDEPQIVETWL